MLASAESASAKTAESSTSAEHIAKHAEDIIHTETARTAETAKASAAGRTVKSKLIILLSLLRVMQYVICLGCFFEFFLSFLVSRITVGMIFYGNFSICLFYFVFRSDISTTKHHIKNYIFQI